LIVETSYPTVTIGSLAHSERGAFKIGPFGSTLKKTELVSAGIPVVGIENILPNRFVANYRRFITEEKFAQLSQYEIASGDVLVSTMGTIGRAAVVPPEVGTAIFDSHLFRMRVDQTKVYPPYLCFGINGYEPLRDELRSRSSGAIMAGVNTTILKECSIPLPPLSEQKRITAILKEQMAEVEQARAAAEAQLKAVKDLPAAYLRKVFDSSEAQRWQRKTVAQMMSSGILLYHQDGNHGELHPRNKDFVASGVKFVTAKHLKGDGTLVLDRAPYISQEQASGLRIGFGKSRDVLLAHNATVGPVGIAPSECEPFIVGTSLTIYRCNEEQLFPLYLFVALRAVSFQQQLYNAMKQTTRNQVPITRQREMIIPIPTLSEQEAIATEFIAQLQVIERATQKLEEQLTDINNLPSAFLRKAFTGKL
jgi:type I restriction enzyme, S subunit